MNNEFQTLLENLDTEKVIKLMKKLGADRYKETDEAIIFPTICHNTRADDASMKLYYYKDNKFFYCYTQCEGMSIFKFLEHYYQTRGREYNWYNDIFEVVKGCSNAFSTKEINFETTRENLKDKYKVKKYMIDLPEINSQVLNCFVKLYPEEWLNDGISREAMDKHNILYSISQNKIVIPHYDVRGRLVGIRGRALNSEEVELVGKYAPIKLEDTWYSHKLSLNLYGLDKNKPQIKRTGICYVFESEKAVLQMDSFNMNNCCVAVCGSNFNIHQLKLLMKNGRPQEIVLCFDNEEKKGEDKYFYKLWNMCKKYSKYCQMSFVYDRKGLTDYKDSPTDKGEEIFRKLLKERVQVKE